MVSLAALVLVILDQADAGFRRWWAGHALTTSTAAGLLVVLITVLVVDQVVTMRQIRERSRAVSAQAAIMAGQAARSAKAVSAALDGSGDRGAASDELRTYMIMLLVGAPVLIDASVSRNFLEQAQHLGAEMARALGEIGGAPGAPTASSAALDDAVARLRAAADPLLQQLNLEELTAAAGGESQRPQAAS